MAKHQPPAHWGPAIFSALALGSVAAFAVAAVCVIFSKFNTPAVFVFGGLVGLALAALMLWLYYWRQITAKEIWQSIGTLWHELGKY